MPGARHYNQKIACAAAKITAILASVFTVLAFRHCVTHVDSAGRPHSLYSRSLFLSSGPFLLLLSYFLLCLGRTAADCPAVENHGGGL